MSGRRLVRALDLVADAELIAAFEAWHRPGAVWPEVVDHIRAHGVLDMEIWRAGERMAMIVEVTDDYPRPIPEPEQVREWEALMDGFQLRLPGTDTKWVEMTRIFSLAEQPGA